MLYISEVIRVTAKSVAAQSFYEATYIEGDKGDTCPCRPYSYSKVVWYIGGDCYARTGFGAFSQTHS